MLFKNLIFYAVLKKRDILRKAKIPYGKNYIPSNFLP